MSFPALTSNLIPTSSRAPSLSSSPPTRGPSPTPTFVHVDPTAWPPSDTPSCQTPTAWNLDLNLAWEPPKLLNLTGKEEKLRDLSGNLPRQLSQGSAETDGGLGSEGMSRRGSAVVEARKGDVETGEGQGKEEEDESDTRRTGWSVWWKIRKIRRWLRWALTLEKFHYTVIGLVVLDLILVFVELILALITAGCYSEVEYELLLEAIALAPAHLHNLKPSDFACVIPPDHRRESLELGLFGTNLAFLSLFSLEVVLSLFAFGPISFLKSWLSCLDGVIVLATLALDVSLYASKSPAGHSAAALVILRFWKVIRAVHAIAHTLELHHQATLKVKKQALNALLREKIAENIRLCFVRNHLIWETGHDVDTVLVEEEVRIKLGLWEERRKEEERSGGGEAT